MTEPLVDVIVPVHSAQRNVETAVLSARSANQGISSRVNVVLHNMGERDVETMRERLGSNARLFRCSDGRPSPSGPRNLGIEESQAPFVFFLDSDDSLAPGCLRSLVSAATATKADVVLPSILADTGPVPAPLTTSRGPRIVSVVADHLFLRAHCFALIDRRCLDQRPIRFPVDVRTGEDLVFMAQLYVSSTVALAPDAVYNLRSGAGDRITALQLSFGDQFAAIPSILAADWFERLSPDVRTVLGCRILAVNIARSWRLESSQRKRRLRSEYASLRDAVIGRAPQAKALLSVRDRVSLRFEIDPGRGTRVLFSRPMRSVPTSFEGALHPAGPIRATLAVTRIKHRGSTQRAGK